MAHAYEKSSYRSLQYLAIYEFHFLIGMFGDFEACHLVAFVNSKHYYSSRWEMIVKTINMRLIVMIWLTPAAMLSWPNNPNLLRPRNSKSHLDLLWNPDCLVVPGLWHKRCWQWRWHLMNSMKHEMVFSLLSLIKFHSQKVYITNIRSYGILQDTSIRLRFK